MVCGHLIVTLFFFFLLFEHSVSDLHLSLVDYILERGWQDLCSFWHERALVRLGVLVLSQSPGVPVHPENVH